MYVVMEVGSGREGDGWRHGASVHVHTRSRDGLAAHGPSPAGLHPLAQVRSSHVRSQLPHAHTWAEQHGAGEETALAFVGLFTIHPSPCRHWHWELSMSRPVTAALLCRNCILVGDHSLSPVWAHLGGLKAAALRVLRARRCNGSAWRSAGARGVGCAGLPGSLPKKPLCVVPPLPSVRILPSEEYYNPSRPAQRVASAHACMRIAGPEPVGAPSAGAAVPNVLPPNISLSNWEKRLPRAAHHRPVCPPFPSGNKSSRPRSGSINHTHCGRGKSALSERRAAAFGQRAARRTDTGATSARVVEA